MLESTYMKTEFEQKAIDLFSSKISKYSINDIKNIETLSGGFTNHCYCFTLADNKKYFVRIGSLKINRTNEYSFLKASKLIKKYKYYDFDTGNAIKIWIDGSTSTFDDCSNFEVFSRIVKQIKKIQSIKLDKIQEIKVRDFYQFINIAKIENIYVNKYKEIIEKYKNLDLVLSHNDIRPSNILINKNKVYLIDFEWCTLNNQYWDLANIVRELEFPLDQLEKVFKKYFKKLDFSVLKDMIFAATCFACQWTFFEKESEELLKYRKNVIRIMNNYYSSFYGDSK
ncbi:predicted choline kinase [Malacoplasma penetrans HF-2]|uniref:Predicted choline kinase n=2 Tax=Malacoplasma penetrans TaxID=28227 RepID=Q8EW91_MALP2|nr:predicted choline kinase [Malacoplasma penetrans HF-2]